MDRGRGYHRGSRRQFPESGNRLNDQFPDDQELDSKHGHNSKAGGRHTGSRGNQNSAEANRRHPPHLSGKAIGLYYASQSKKKREFKKTDKPTPLDSHARRRDERHRHKDSLPTYDIKLDENVISKIRKVLAELDEIALNKSQPLINRGFRDDYLRNVTGNLAAADAEIAESGTLLVRNEVLDVQLQNELQDKIHNPAFKEMLPFREKLPVYRFKQQVIDTIERNQVTVISGETGSGKTTQIPQFILDQVIRDGNGSTCNIICTQPRRISTIAVAERVAEERGENVGGNSLGYSIRLDSKLPKRSGGTLSFMVTGVLLQRLRANPLLADTSHVIVDEVHERDVLSDFILVILKDLISKRPDLKVVLMSATLNSSKFSKFFNDCPILEIPGQNFTVTEYYLEDVLEFTKFKFPEPTRVLKRRDENNIQIEEFNQLILPYYAKQRREKKIPPNVIHELCKPNSEDLDYDLIQATLEHIVRSDLSGGAVLIFVTGWDQISRLIETFEKSGRFPSTRYIFYPLHSMMPTANQKDIFKSPPPGIRKVIIATNIAETSITIDDILHVIDTGRIKQTNLNTELNLQTLDNEWVSRANAQQRRGRAGRVRSGYCYHLFSRGRERLLQDFKLPEILRTKLEEPILLMKNLKAGLVSPFFQRFMDPPNERTLQLALERLQKIGAIDSSEVLTPLGFHLSKLPMDPYTGKMILMAAIFSCIDPILSCAASLSFKNCFQVPMGHEQKVDAIRQDFSGDTRSDHFATIRAIEGYQEAVKYRSEGSYCYRNYLSQGTIRNLLDVKKQFAEHLYSMEFIPTTNLKHLTINQNSTNIALVSAIIASGLYPNVAFVKRLVYRRKKNEMLLFTRTHEDGNVAIHPKSVNSKPIGQTFPSRFLVYFEKMKSTKVYLHDTSIVTPLPLLFFGGELDYILDTDGFGTIGVDGLTRFRCQPEVYNLIKTLREKLDEMLTLKIENPGPTHWNTGKSDAEELILGAIRDLLTGEYALALRDDENEDESEDGDDFDEEAEVRPGTNGSGGYF